VDGIPLAVVWALHAPLPGAGLPSRDLRDQRQLAGMAGLAPPARVD